MAEKRVTPWVVWKPGDGDQGDEALSRLADALPGYFGDSRLVDSRWSGLSFYAAHRLAELHFVRHHGVERAFVLHGADRTLWLNGDSGPMHEVNEAESLVLTDVTVEDYVRFFFYFLGSNNDAFVLIETADEVGSGDGAASSRENRDTAGLLDEVRNRVKPLVMRGRDATGRWLLDVTVAHDGDLFGAAVAVKPNGEIEMIDDDPICALGGLAVPEGPSLELEDTGESSGDISLSATPGGLGSTVGLPRDREVTEAVVAVLLEDAIRELNSRATAGNVLLHHFNLETQPGKPIEQLSRLMAHSQPIVIIESDVPFVEVFVAGLVAPADTLSSSTVRGTAMAGDDLRCEIALNDGIRLYLLSFTTYRGLFDAERAAQDLALSQAAVLIGCNQSDDVPEPLRRMTDLIVTFPRIDRRLFARIFERVFHIKPAADWDAPGADWTRYLVPEDFHTPRRLGLGPTDALSLLRDRVRARLAQVTPDTGPRLGELQGMGEARQVAEDLIADIGAAQAGQIPWSAVDRGLLLIGASGTGKTTLARAIAKECGIKFIVASASKWQSAGYLDAHLRAMRADFAEARRYAPAILFLDEIDSIGSREHLAEQTANYQTEVINALLEEIQGISTTGSVMVIGATNYLERVDPALRRAGRLDQVVQIPLPNIDSLEQIFGYYLSLHRAEGGTVAADVDARSLAQLAFGLTGADVEFFVRGAARRARREDRPMAQIDLVAEVTRRPRRPDSAPRLGPAEMHRVAVHEAGHTVARMLSSSLGEDLTFVSIIPRLDGSLGFTAAVPSGSQMMTRRTMLEQLETMLAGRAAEEVVFGADDVGAGAGGPDTHSDLAVATQLATFIVCQSGLGGDGRLRWTTQPSAAQDQQIDDLLRTGYSSILARLQTRRPLLDRIAAALDEKQELSGSELRQLVTSSNGTTPTTALDTSTPQASLLVSS